MLLLGLLLCAWAVAAEQVSFFKSVSVSQPWERDYNFHHLTSVKSQRPDINPPVLHIEYSDPSKLAPGYIFIAPYEAENPGPYIYDNSGV